MNFIYFSLPIISVYFTSIFYPVRQDAGKNISFRPPPYVFAIVWPILLLLLGYSWTLRPNISLYYLILTLLLATWSIFFNYSKTLAFYNIIFTLILSIFIFFYKFNNTSYLLLPLIGWLGFASILNYYLIN